jgi:hypothetical protein
MTSDETTETRRGPVPGILVTLIVVAMVLALVAVVITVARTTPSPTQADDLIATQAISLVVSGSWQPSDVPAGVSTYFVNGPDRNGNSTYAVPVTRDGVSVVVCLSIAAPYNGSTVVPCPPISKILSNWTPGNV